MLHNRLPESVCIGAPVGIVSSPIPFEHGQVKYTVFQQPHALLLLDVTIQLPTQDNLVTELDQQCTWCQLHNHLGTMHRPSKEVNQLEVGTVC